MTVKIEPQEVRAHLHEMGYLNVSTEHLMDFIADLKKLIKYDARRCNCNNSYFPEKSQTTDHTPVFEESLENPKVSCSYADDVDTLISWEEGNFSVSGKKQSSRNALIKKNNKESNAPAKKLVERGNLSNTRARSAFIKPWQLQGPLVQRRSDPVALYHMYQSLWQQQKVPGDNHHESLRWNVRERMLGGDPVPRPTSRSTSADGVNRPTWNYR